MDLNDPIHSLRHRRFELRLQGRVWEMVAVQLEILSIAQSKGRPLDIANEWNYLSVLYHRAGRYGEAEQAAKSALSTYEAVQEQSVEIVATYEMVLAYIFAAQGRLHDAIVMAESAVAHYGVFHSPPDEFLARQLKVLEAIRAGQAPQFEG